MDRADDALEPLPIDGDAAPPTGAGGRPSKAAVIVGALAVLVAGIGVGRITTDRSADTRPVRPAVAPTTTTPRSIVPLVLARDARGAWTYSEVWDGGVRCERFETTASGGVEDCPEPFEYGRLRLGTFFNDRHGYVWGSTAPEVAVVELLRGTRVVLRQPVDRTRLTYGIVVIVDPPAYDAVVGRSEQGQLVEHQCVSATTIARPC